MGFFDNYSDEDTSGLNWVGKEEKQALVDNAIAFPVNEVLYTQSKFGPRYVIKTELAGESRAIGFAAESVGSRDAMLEAMKEYLASDDATAPVVYLLKVGRSIVIKNAEGESN